MPPKPPAKKAADPPTAVQAAPLEPAPAAAAPVDDAPQPKLGVSTLTPGNTKLCMTRGRAHHIATSSRDSRTWVLGGWEGVDDTTVSGIRQSEAPHVLSLAPLQDQWVAVDAVGDAHPGTSQAAGVDVGDAVLVYGGWDGTKRVGRTSIFSYEDARWAAFVTSDGGDAVHPPPLTFHSASYLPKKVFVFGGNHSDGQSNDMYVLDLTTTQWHQCPTLGAPPKRSSHTACVLSENFIAVFGGRGGPDGSTVLQDTALFDGTSQHWVIGSKVEGPSPPARYGHAAINAREKMVISGGIGADGECLTDIWMLHLVRPGVMSWTKLATEGDALHGRCGHSLTWVTSNRLLVLGGRKDPYTTIASSQLLDLSALLPKEDDDVSSKLSRSGPTPT
jgi:hypothetical protein